MKQRIIFIVFTLLLSASACGGPRVRIAPSLGKQRQRVAVLGFSSSGFMGGQNLSAFTADRFSEELFLQEKAVVVDRSVVKAALLAAGIYSQNLNKPQLRRLAAALDVRIVILGDVRNNSPGFMGELDNQKKRISITARIVDCASGKVAGVLTKEKAGNDASERIVKQIVREMIASWNRKWKTGKAENPEMKTDKT